MFDTHDFRRLATRSPSLFLSPALSASRVAMLLAAEFEPKASRWRFGWGFTSDATFGSVDDMVALPIWLIVWRAKKRNRKIFIAGPGGYRTRTTGIRSVALKSFF